MPFRASWRLWWAPESVRLFGPELSKRLDGHAAPGSLTRDTRHRSMTARVMAQRYPRRTMFKMTRPTAAALVAAFALAACRQQASSTTPPTSPTIAAVPTTPIAATPAPSVTIKIDMSYSALVTTTIKAGQSVRFVPLQACNQEQLTDDIKTPFFGADGYVVTFDRPGSFSYRSTIHGSVHGVVTVR